jgi:lipid II:glycine glycyltransferase (peptidoglycan interpeptide bridge formation enzyme)
MYIKEINTDLEEKYTGLFGCEPAFSGFKWREHVHGTNLKVYGIFEDDEQLIGAFHLYQSKKIGFTFIKTPHYMPHIGLTYNNRSQNESSRLSFNKKIIEHVCEFIQSLQHGVISIALPPFVIDTQPFFWKKFKVIPNYTYRINLGLSIEEIEKRFSPEHRNSIKKALKDGVEVKECHDYAVIKKIILKTFEQKGEAVSNENIDNILFKIANPGNSFAFTSNFNNEVIAGSFCLYDNDYCYYLLGGYSNESKQHGAGALCIYNSILKAKQLNIPVFDLEGSMIKEVERYFRSFGGELVPYYTINKAKLPFEMVLKFIKRELF